MMIFEDKRTKLEGLWNSLHILAPLWAFCSTHLKGFPLSIIKLDWAAVSLLILFS